MIGQQVFGRLMYAEYCTIATASKKGVPEAATVFFVWHEGALYFKTLSTYRKFSNLQENPVASIVITVNQQTVQMDGTVELLSGKDIELAKELVKSKKGRYSSFDSLPEQRYFRFSPSWIRVMVDKAEYETLLG